MASSTDSSSPAFNASNVDLNTADPRDVICALATSSNEYSGQLGTRISALFVILIVSTAATFFPVIAKRVPRMHIPVYVYLFARYFGAGVIVATAFIHLLDPAYGEIGPQTCVGMTKGWASYSWCPAIVLTSVMAIFLLDFGAERYVEIKYGVQSDADIQEAVTGQGDRRASATSIVEGRMEHEDRSVGPDARRPSKAVTFEQKFAEDFSDEDVTARERSFRQQIAAFLILEFGVIFHSVIISLNLGVVGSEFSTLYPVLVFHQSFEGLGIGARMSTIPFKPHSWLPWLLCAAYGLTVSSSYDI
jgi:solute carrier family 39 (zinc transporter), member 1/2/3